MTVLIVPDRFPSSFFEDFSNGIGYWSAGTPPFEGPIGGPREVAGGIFRSFDWSYDSNHLVSRGGPGMLHLLAYADQQLWSDGTDFTNARIKLRARGVNFNPNGSQFICWITANHPYRLHANGKPKNVNWGFVAEPRTALLQTGSWEDIEWVLSPDPSKWVWGKGASETTYDTFLSLQESLQNICNVHFLMLGPDNVGHPLGSFELDSCSILYNRKAAEPASPPPPPPPPSPAVDGPLIPLMTGETTANVRITADANCLGEPWRVGDRTNGPDANMVQWTSPPDGNGDLSIELQAGAWELASYQLGCRDQPLSQDYAPYAWRMYDATDLNNLVLLDERLSQPAWAQGDVRPFALAQRRSGVTRVLFRFLRSMTQTYLQVQSLQLIGQ